MPNSQPATSTGLRPTRSESVPAKKFVAAFTAPNATMNVSVAVNAVRWNVRVASSGSTVRSWPIIPPTSALTPTRSENCARFSRSPSRMGFAFSLGADGHSRARPVAADHSAGPPRSTEMSSRSAAARIDAPDIARSPCPHMTVTGPTGS